MKRHFNRLLQRKRTDIDSSSTMRRSRTTVGVAAAAATTLKPQDGYDWLREITRFQVRCAQP